MEINIKDLISCDCCGIVLDKSKLKFPKDIYLKDGSPDHTKATWCDYDYVPYIRCPVCNESILETADER